MGKIIKDRVEEIGKDRQHGAGWLAAYAVETLIQSIEKSRAKSVPEILEEAKNVLDAISAARPNMVYIANAAARFFAVISHSKPFKDNAGYFIEDVTYKGKGYLEKMEASAGAAADNAATMIFKGDTVLTGSYSSMLVRTLLAAKSRNPSFRVLVCKSEFGGLSYGDKLKTELDTCGINSEIIPDKEINKYTGSANEVMIGADAVLPSGEIINGKPSRKLAEAAWDAGMCTFIVCEDGKFDVLERINKAEIEPAFDLVPASLWTAIITESGKISPSEFNNHQDYLRASYKQGGKQG